MWVWVDVIFKENGLFLFWRKCSADVAPSPQKRIGSCSNPSVMRDNEFVR